MTKYLIFIPPHFGHINPTLAIGAELLQRGHSVTWLGFKKVSQTLLPRGGQFYFPEEFQKSSSITQNILSRQDEAASNTANKMIRWAFESTWLPFYELTSRYLGTIIDRVQPDVLVHDEGLFGAALWAHKNSMPYITSISSAPGLYYRPANVLLSADALWLSELMRNIKASLDIQDGVKVLNSPRLNLVFTSSSFVGGQVFPERYAFIGPTIRQRPENMDFSWREIDKISERKIYVSTGSLLRKIQKPFYQKVVDAFAGTNLKVMLNAPSDLLSQWPENFIVRPYWPQLEALQRADAVITPGGFNTLNESLYFGKPVVVIPMANDQFGNAGLVEHSGCGLRLRLRRLTADQLRSSTFEILSNPIYRQAAQRLQADLRSGGGETRAVDMIESSLARNNPQTNIVSMEI